MFAWLLMVLGVCWAVNLVRSEPGVEPWVQRDVLSWGKGSCLGQNAPGVRVPAIRTSPLHAVHCAALSMYCRASTVQEEGGQKNPTEHIFLSS